MPNIHQLKKITLASALACTLAATVAMAQTPYDEGQKALRDQQWMDAVEQFEQAAEQQESQADAATYWMAYAYFKANRAKEAERELRRLERKYPDSPWLKEAQALRLEHQDPERAAAKIADGELQLDDEMKLFALMQLMERDPARATPLVMDLAQNAASENTRRDALFLLAMSDDENSRGLLFDFARDSKDPELQRQAIEMLGVLEATDELRRLYPTQDAATKARIIESLSVAGDTGMLRQVLENETDPELRKAAIFGIALNDDDGAGEFAEEIYRSAESVDEKMSVLDSMVMMDDAREMALDILRTESDPRLQVHAIHVLGVMEATGELGELYDQSSDQAVRSAIIEALSIAEDGDALIRIAEQETDPKLRAVAVQSLAVNGSPEASKYLLEMYHDAPYDEKAEIIRSMLILEDSDALLALMKQEEDPRLKREMLQILVVMGSDEIDDELFQMLETEQ
jgi:outer membrane protein assembly factor BamD (BamD/ComL family)